MPNAEQKVHEITDAVQKKTRRFNRKKLMTFGAVALTGLTAGLIIDDRIKRKVGYHDVDVNVTPPPSEV